MFYTEEKVIIQDNGDFKVEKENFSITTIPKTVKKLGVMIIGIGGNNGSTFTSALLAHRKNIEWNGEKRVEFLGSLSQKGSVKIGRDTSGRLHTKLFSEIGDFHSPSDIVISGWDICGDNLYEATKKAKVLDYDLMVKLEQDLKNIHPLSSVYDSNFVASNQDSRANNIIHQSSRSKQISIITTDIQEFKQKNKLDKVVILWSASTERFHNGEWKTGEDLYKAIENNDPEIPPSIIFAVAAAHCGCIFLNGSPQNTICSSVVDIFRKCKAFLGGEDFKTGQTRLKTVLVDWLASSGIRPLSVVSYNHLGNNDGKNLDEASQFHSKEVSKSGVLEDVIEANPHLFDQKPLDHTVVIKYVPSVGDSKRAIDEYYSELMMGGKHTLSIYNICEDSLLAVPVMLDIILFSEFFSRITVTSDKRSIYGFDSVISLLSYFFKAPITNKGEQKVNSFFTQRTGLENFFRILIGLPPITNISLSDRVR